MPSTIPVRLGPRSYDMVIEPNAFPAKLSRHSLVRASSRILVVADARLTSAAKRFEKTMGKRVAGLILLRGGERTKNLSSLPKLYSAAARARLDRKSLVVAIGGGVIGDCAGFFAATYLRGIRIVHVPTTLISQVDSAIGGKTGVNLPEGKNLVGSFHQPSLVLVDPNFLKTLPDREFRSGLAEVIKYGIIADATLFNRLEKRMPRILKRDPAELAWIIERSCRIKANVVSHDEREVTGLRATLNFGHTLGHAIEAAARYRSLHGEAIALGMIAATTLSCKLEGLPAASARRIASVILAAGLPTRLPSNVNLRNVLEAMKVDKKTEGGKIRFVLAKKIGKVKTGIIVSELQIGQALCSLR